MKFTANGLDHFYTDSITSTQTRKLRTVVFIHGFPHTHHLWDEQVKGLASQLRVITYDLREHGQSQIGDGTLLIEFFVDDLISLLDHLQLQQVTLVGLSMGGYIALRAMERNPERFESLVLCDTSSDPDNNAAKLKRAKSIQMIREKGLESFVESYTDGVLMPETLRKNPELQNRFRKMILENKPPTVKGTFAALSARMDMNPVLSSIRVPTLIIVGEKDQITPLEQAKKLQAGISGSRLEIIPGVGHLSSFESPEVFNSALLQFLG